MAILDDCKKALRITSTTYDSEIQGYIDYAEASLEEAGVLYTTSPMAKVYKVTMVKAMFGFNNPDSEKLQELADKQLSRLALLKSHIGE